jgi:NAD(P)-dependent dehydrogenase (short-subunit alcohol dehydrogenase family)
MSLPTTPQDGHALVTGAGRGIGRGCALALARAGVSVTLMSRSPAELEEVAGEIGQMGVSASVRPGDVADAADVARVVEGAFVDGPLSICVNAAGINRPGPSDTLPAEDFDAVMAINVRGTFLVARAVGARWLELGRAGRLINLSSQMGSVGYPGRAAYCASKHAVDGLTKALGVEWAPAGITVNAVAPTFVRTPFTAGMLAEPDFREDVLRRIPMGRVGEVDEVVGAVLFLASPAAGLITGHVLAVDGGWTAW